MQKGRTSRQRVSREKLLLSGKKFFSRGHCYGGIGALISPNHASNVYNKCLNDN